jgi:hypothetical protein
MAVEGLDTGKKLAVVANGNEDLVVGSDGGVEDAEGTGGELVLFKLSDFVLSASLRSAASVRQRTRGGGKCVRELGARLGEQFSGT